jgi:hypothetical protein
MISKRGAFDLLYVIKFGSTLLTHSCNTSVSCVKLYLIKYVDTMETVLFFNAWRSSFVHD